MNKDVNSNKDKNLYNIFSLICSLGIIIILLITISYLPEFGSPNNPSVNEVSQRYIEKGLEETGATNIVAGMILDYRAFDTFGEAAMLFTAMIGIIILLKNTKESDSHYEENS